LFTIVAGESIANDGVAAVLVSVLVPLARGGAVPSLWGALGTMAYAALGGTAIGIAFALSVTPLLRRERRDWERIVTTLVVAYGSYAAASLLGMSGIFASAAAGVALPSLALAKRDATVVEHFWDRTAEFANGLVFLLVGLNLRVDRIAHEPGLVVAVLVAVLVSRALLAYGLVPFVAALRSRSHAAIALAGVRGGLSLALALGLPADVVDRPLVIDAVFAVVFATLIVQGSTIAPLLRRLRLSSQ
jgi:CPA1 family monovalent cation:H+ antiporter